MTDYPVPEGYEPIEVHSIYDRNFGTLYVRKGEGDYVLGFRVMKQHLNETGVMHGGALATFADWQVMSAKYQANIDVHTPTISLTVDYLSPTPEGSWLEAHVNLQKQTRKMLFTSTEFWAGEVLVARSNAIYKLRSPVSQSNADSNAASGQ